VVDVELAVLDHGGEEVQVAAVDRADRGAVAQGELPAVPGAAQDEAVEAGDELARRRGGHGAGDDALADRGAAVGADVEDRVEALVGAEEADAALAELADGALADGQFVGRSDPVPHGQAVPAAAAAPRSALRRSPKNSSALSASTARRASRGIW